MLPLQATMAHCDSCLAIPDATTLAAVRSRVQFKLCTLMHAIHNQRSPSYLSDTVQTVATATIRCGLRSSASTDMSCRVHFPSSVSGPSRMQDLLPGTAFQITFVASLHLQPSEDT